MVLSANPTSRVTSTFSTWKAGWTLDTKNDWKHDGKFVVAGGKTMPADTPMDQLSPFLPDNGAEVKGDLVMVNGIMTDLALQSEDLQAMANKGFSVIGVHNATKGMAFDLAQCVGDKLDVHLAENGAISTTMRLLHNSLDNQQPVRLVGHSQGALVISSALHAVSDELKESGLSQEQTEDALSKVAVTSLGGAAATFPEGPTYSHVYNTYDVVPMVSGRPVVAVVSPNQKERFYRISVVRDNEELPPWSNGISNRLARWVDQTTHGPQHVYLPNVPEGVIA